jgi:hypothetical protein
VRKAKRNKQSQTNQTNQRDLTWSVDPAFRCVQATTTGIPAVGAARERTRSR